MSAHDIPVDRGCVEAKETTARTTRGKGLRGDVRGGLASALVAIPHALGNGAIVFLPLGVGHIGLGVAAGLSAAVAGALISALLGKPRYQILSGSTTGAVILATLVATLASNPALKPHGALLVMEITAMIFAAVFLAGAMQLAFAWLRLGRALKFIPQPVLTGFMLGIALQLFLRQINPLLGLGADTPILRLPLRLGEIQLWSLSVGVLTFGVAVWIQRASEKLPATMIALLVGILSFALFRGTFTTPGDVLGDTSGDFLNNSLLRHLIGGRLHEVWRSVWVDVCATAALLAVVGSILTLLSAAVVDAATGSNQDGDRTLFAQGLSNLCSAAIGGMFVGGTNMMSVANYQSGGRTALSAFTVAIAGLAVLIGAGGLLHFVPVAAVAGLMLTVAFNIVEDVLRENSPSGQQNHKASRARNANMAIILLVGTLTAFVNIIAAALIGVVASSILLVAKISATNIYRLSDGKARSSLKARGADRQLFLRDNGTSIGIVELNGYVFFGTADRMRAEIEDYSSGRKVMILDFRRVYEIEACGIRELVGLASTLDHRGIALGLSNVSENASDELAASATPSQTRTLPTLFNDMDAALEWAEEQLLSTSEWRAQLQTEIPVSQAELFDGFDPAELAVLAKIMEREDLPIGHTLFEEGDAGDRMFVLTRGEVCISVALAGTSRRKRLASFGPGMVFGEMSLLEGKPRSAAAIVTSEATIYSMDAAVLARLQETHEQLALKIVTNLAKQIAARLRIASEQLRAGG